MCRYSLHNAMPMDLVRTICYNANNCVQTTVPVDRRLQHKACTFKPLENWVCVFQTVVNRFIWYICVVDTHYFVLCTLCKQYRWHTGKWVEMCALMHDGKMSFSDETRADNFGSGCISNLGFYIMTTKSHNVWKRQKKRQKTKSDKSADHCVDYLLETPI